MRFPLRTPSLLVTAIAALAAPLAHGADAELEALKAQFQAQLDRLEKRVNTLETENAQLKRQTTVATGTKASPEIASLKQRVAELELNAERPIAQAAAVSKRAAANAEAIDAIELKLQASATETRDIYRDDAGWPFDVRKLYDLARPFEFHGYFRSGFGMNSRGGKMEAFKAPGAGAKYRWLGRWHSGRFGRERRQDDHVSPRKSHGATCVDAGFPRCRQCSGRSSSADWRGRRGRERSLFGIRRRQGARPQDQEYLPRLLRA